MVCGAFLLGAFIFCATGGAAPVEPVRNYSLQPVEEQSRVLQPVAARSAVVAKAQDRMAVEPKPAPKPLWFLTFGESGPFPDTGEGKYFMVPDLKNKAACEAEAARLRRLYKRQKTVIVGKITHHCSLMPVRNSATQ